MLKPAARGQNEAFVSIIIVTADRPGLLRNCLESIRRERAPFEIEIILVLNGGSDPEIGGDLKPQDKIIQCSRTTPAAARNLAIKKASGEYICFLDDDVTLPSGYFTRFWEARGQEPVADVIGGPDRTIPNASALERAIGLALESPLATATTRDRHSSRNSRIVAGDEKKLILCNLWIRSWIFKNEGFEFDERFFRNEENVLIHHLAGKKIVYDPGLFVFHRRKTRLRAMARAVTQSGYFRAKSYFLFPGSVSAEFFAPTLFLIYLIGCVCLSLPYRWFPLLAYGALNLGFSFALALANRDVLVTPLVSFYQAFILLCYGAGFSRGMIETGLRLRTRKPRSVP